MSEHHLIKNIANKKNKKIILEKKVEIIAGIVILISSLFLGNITGLVIQTSPETDKAIGLPLAVLSLGLIVTYLLLRFDSLKPKS